jgi:hypothetical protein
MQGEVYGADGERAARTAAVPSHGAVPERIALLEPPDARKEKTMTIEIEIPLPPVGRYKAKKLYDADDGDRWRKAKHDLQAKCCGEVDASGTCFAPACRQGEALKAMHEMLEHIDFCERERMSSREPQSRLPEA